MTSPVNSISTARLREVARESATAGVAQNSPRLMPDTAKRAPRRADGQIALGDELAPRGGREAVDLRDDGLGEAHDLQHQVAARAEEPRDVAGLLATYLPEVVAGAEGPSAARDDDHPHRFVSCDGVHFDVQRLQQAGGQRVVLQRAVEGEHGDPVAVGAEERTLDANRSPDRARIAARSGDPKTHFLARARTAWAASTMARSDGTTSSHVRVLSPQSGFTQSCAAGMCRSAFSSRAMISSRDGIRGE